MVREWPAGGGGRELGSVHETREYDGTSALDVIVEDWVLVSEALEVGESVVGREVLELNKEFGEEGGHRVHELVHELIHDIITDAALTKTEVEGIVEELLVVGSEIEADGDSGFRSNTNKVLLGS